ncbi:hypothetical protein [Paenibacillus aquistagni]|uniref:hypothetical protein n=1 Tax=Paenibacillus aquistagni TaxID=1852522 RepID=UPI00145A24F8|nr:hypothetical protein [Paenibacillus aquistagni]NMM53664.1 hypothetical protein [Paenibacillus aquistagni]
MNRWKRANLVLLAALLLVVMIQPGKSYAYADRMMSLTPPPPPSPLIMPLGFFDPSNQYLEQGETKIYDNGDQTVTIEMSTTSYSQVSSIGATVTLQMWTGGTWANIGTSTTKSKSNDWYFKDQVTKVVARGYYFRVKSTHWISTGNVYEQGEIISNSILVK